MKESQFSFEYSEKDLEPVRPLFTTMIVVQVLAALVAAVRHWLPTLTENLVIVAFLAAFPGYLVGLYVQTIRVPGSLGHNKILVRRLGFIAAFLSANALVFFIAG